jgi:hypothetical protein
VQLPNMFPQPVTLGTQETVALLLHITDVAEVLIVQVQTTQTAFDRLEDEGIDVSEEDRYYPYRATYDIEVMLQPTDKRRSEKLEWISHHVLLSAASQHVSTTGHTWNTGNCGSTSPYH